MQGLLLAFFILSRKEHDDKGLPKKILLGKRFFGKRKGNGLVLLDCAKKPTDQKSLP